MDDWTEQTDTVRCSRPGGRPVTLRQQFHEILADLWRIVRVKPWLVLWPVTMVAWLQRGDPDVPWWLRFDTTTEDSP